jgi:predicted ATPase
MITRVRARNFKSLRDVEFSLGPLNVLIGPNMGGKSNIVDLFRFLQECWFPAPATLGPPNALARRQGIDEVLWKGGRENLLSIGLELELSGKNFSYEMEIAGGPGGWANLQNERLELQGNGERHSLIVQDETGRWLRNLDSAKLVSVQGERSAMELAPPNWDGYAVKWFAQNWRFHQFVPGLMKQANQMNIGNVLDAHGSNLSAWLMWLQTKAPGAFARIDEVMRDVFPEVSQLLTWPTSQGTVYLSSREKGLLRSTPLFQMSDGELVFAAFLSLILAPDELGGTLFVIEEPENHLHPRLLDTLIALLRQGRQEAAARGTVGSQVICTTHSPFLLDQMKLEEILYVEKRQAETTITRPNDKPHLRKLIEDEKTGLGDLMFAGALGGE